MGLLCSERLIDSHVTICAVCSDESFPRLLVSKKVVG